MGMELYANSPVARAVWDEADVHLGEVYGFSILEIVSSAGLSVSSSINILMTSFALSQVRTNPKEKTVHFGGLKGQATRQKYMEMTYTTSKFLLSLASKAVNLTYLICSRLRWKRQDSPPLR